MKKKLLLALNLVLLSGFTLTNTLVSCDQKEEPLKKQSIEIKTPISSTLEVGSELILEAAIEGFEDEYKILWISSNLDVASITQTGKVIALKEGQTQITAKIENVESLPLTITVQKKKVVSIEIEFEDSTKNIIEEGQESLIKFNKLENAAIDEIKRHIDDEQIIKIEGTKITALKAGSTKFCAFVDEFRSNELEIKVLPISDVLTIEILNPDPDFLIKGQNLVLQSTIKGNINNYKPLWSSSNQDVAKINEETGEITPLKAGTVKFILTVGPKKAESILFNVLDDYSPVESISLLEKEITLGLDEEYEFKPTILPKSARQEFRIEVDDEIYLQVDNNKIIAKKITSSPIELKLIAGDKECIVKVRIIKLIDKVIPEIETKLKESLEIEKKTAKDGYFNKIIYDKDNVEDSYEKYNFEVFSDNKTTSVLKEKFSWGIEESRFTHAIDDDRLVKVEEEKKDNDEYELASHPFIIREIGEEADISKELALESVSLPFVGKENVDGKGGISYHVLNEFISNSYFKNSAASEYFTYEKNKNSYILKTEIWSYSNLKKVTLELNFAENSLLKDAKSTIEVYECEEDWDSGVTTIIGLEETIKYEYKINEGEREKSSDLIDLNKLYANDFNCDFYTGYGSDKVVSKEFNVGDNISFELKDASPDTFNDEYDKPLIVATSDSETLKINPYGTGLEALKETSKVSVTISTKKVTKTFDLKIKALSAEKISFKGSQFGLINEEIEVGSTISPNNAVVDLKAECISDNKEFITITKLEDNKFNLLASKTGEYLIKVRDLKTELSYDQHLYFYDNSDNGRTELIFTNKVTLDPSYYNNKSISNFNFTRNEESTTGTISFTFEDSDWGDTYEISGTWEIKNGKFFVESDDYDNYIESIKFNEFNGYDTIDVAFCYDGYESSSLRIKISK